MERKDNEFKKFFNVEDLTEVASLRNKDIRGAPTAYAYVGDHLTHHSSSVQGKLAVSCTDSSIVLWGLDQNKLHPFLTHLIEYCSQKVSC